MAPRKATRFILQMPNRPGELTKLTRFLAQEGVVVSGITVASVGDVASIEFTAELASGDLPERLKRSGLEARVAS